MRTTTKQALGLTAVTLLIPAGLALSLTAITTTPDEPAPWPADTTATIQDDGSIILPPCEDDDSAADDCYWDAAVMGNGIGDSFVTVGGVTTYAEPIQIEPEPAPEPAPVTAPPVYVEPEPIPAPEPVAEPAPVITEPAPEPVLTFDSLPLTGDFGGQPTVITPEVCGPDEVLAEDYSCVGTDYWD